MAAAHRWRIQPFIDGTYLQSRTVESFSKLNPATERVLYDAAVGSPADIDKAVRVARQRFEDGCWSELPVSRRIDVLLKLADLLVQHRDELALLDTLEMGKPIQAALFDAEFLAPSILRSCAGLADKVLGACAPLSSGALVINTHEPRGVIGAVIPWNFPLANAVIKLAPALAVGNAVVLKPSELASGSALKLAELALEAGVPAGVVNVVPGLGSTVGGALALHRDIDFISFTGSTATGRKIMEMCGRSNGKPLLLECGGKSPQVVFDDVEQLDRIADAVVQSALWNQGQVCSSHTRLIVHQRIKQPLLEKVVARAGRHRPGDPLDECTTFGPLASPAQRDRVKHYVDEGLRSGAEAVLRGHIAESGGCYVAPTVFDRVEPGMKIAREEIFGPVLCLQEFSTEEEAITLANATEYGLVATVWTRDVGRARRAAHSIRAGSIILRSGGEEISGAAQLLSYEPQKASGFGSEIGLQGLLSYTTLKAVTFVGA